MSGDRETLDSLREDMAEHQKRVGKEPTDAANAALVAPVLEQHDKMRAAYERSREQVFVPPPRRTEMTIENRVVDDRTYKLKLQPEPERAKLTTNATPEMAWFLAHAYPRLMLLLSLPETGAMGQASWHQRVKAVMSQREKAGAWKAAADAPADLELYRYQIEKDQRLMKLFGLETVSQLTPAFARAKQRELEEAFLNELCLLLDDSNALFGDWKADPEKKVTASG